MSEEKKKRFALLMQTSPLELTNRERIELSNLAAELLMQIPLEQRLEQYSQVMAQIAKEFPVMR